MIYTRASDGAQVLSTEALDAAGKTRPGYRGQIGPGDYVNFDVAFMDAAPSSASFLHDAAGQPRRFNDALTGMPVQISDAQATAITGLAAKLGVPVESYVRDHLRYLPAGA